LQHTQYC